MFLDIGVGIFLSLWLGGIFLVSHMAAWIWTGVVFALLPDVDALVSLVQYRSTKMAYKHRDLLHLPLVYIPLGSLIMYFFHPALAALFALCSLAHFLHDSVGIGWGVQWLWPISRDHFSFLYLYQPAEKPSLPRKLFYRFKHEDIDRLDREHGDPEWIDNIYRKLHPYALVELCVFFFSLIALYIALR